MAARSTYLGRDLLDSDEEEAGGQHTRPRRTQSQNGNVGTQPARHETNGMSTGERRFVLALDFGTTFTGVAFASVEARATNYPHSNKIEVVRNWGRAMGNMDKVPSVISYSSPGEPEWGSNISGDALTLINQKLELELQEERVDELGLTLRVLNGTRGLSFDHIRDAGPNPDFPCSTPEQIVTDYLRQVFQCTRDAIKVKELGRTSTPVDLVVTMPVTWSYQARNAVFRAATAAGFNSTGIPSLRETILVSEPEAAAYYTARECGAGLLKENRCFVICDAGGGTVDSVAYRVTQLRPHLQLERVTKPTGSKCGSALIDTEFKRWLRRVIGEQNYAMLDPDAARQKATNAYEMESPAMRKLIKEFFVAKSTFKNYERSRRAAIKIELPEPLDKLTIENRVDEGALITKWKGMKQLMDKCVNPAVALVRKQIEAVGSSRGTEVKTVFLVGGFGASPYLQEELRSSFELMDVTVFHPPKDSLTAVVQGAVIHGIERPQGNRTVTMTSMTKTYGYVESSYNLRWFIKTGDLIMRGSPAIWQTDDFWMIPPSSEHSTITFRLFRYDTGDANINQRLPINWKKSCNDVEVAGIVKVPRGDLTRGPMAGLRQMRFFGPFIWRVTCNDTDLFAQLLLNGSVIGTCYNIATERKEYNKKPSGGPYGECNV